MPKSIPSPTNRTKNPAEIKFRAPTRNSPHAAEIAKPIAMLTATANMIRAERSAIHKMARTVSSDIVALSPAFCLIVSNSSSAIGIEPCQAHACAIVCCEMLIRCGLPDRIGGGTAGLKRTKIEPGLHLDQASQVRRFGWFVAGQRLPGKRCELAGEDGFDRLSGHAQRARHVVE